MGTELVGQGAALISVIERAATNADVDIEKMERLFSMHERIVAKAAESEFNSALSNAQGQMGRISADASNSQTRSRYATYGKLDSVLRPIYTEHGFALSFDTGDSPAPEVVRVVCHISHKGGHSRSHHVDMPADGKGAKGGDVMTKTHASGAAMSYGMRYLLKMIFNVAIGEDDTDGNAPAQIISTEQAAEIKAELQATGSDTLGFLKAMGGYGSVDEIRSSGYERAMKMLEKKRASMGAGNASRTG